jgi:hypothetical protein
MLHAMANANLIDNVHRSITNLGAQASISNAELFDKSDEAEGRGHPGTVDPRNSDCRKGSVNWPGLDGASSVASPAGIETDARPETVLY